VLRFAELKPKSTDVLIDLIMNLLRNYHI